ncbi:SMP-30/gluconolactonase/LRE family protein [Streptomyces nojiriensis]
MELLPAATPTTALRTALTTALTTALALACLGAAPASALSSSSDARMSTAFSIPGAKVYPEGIATDARTHTVYVGSYADGTVYRARPGRTEAEVFLPSGTDGRHTANGLRVDARGRLWVTDSTAGVSVYDTRTGSRLAHFEVAGGGPRFVNDLTITPDGAAYLTDSVRGVIYRVTPEQLAAGSGPSPRRTTCPRPCAPARRAASASTGSSRTAPAATSSRSTCRRETCTAWTSPPGPCSASTSAAGT